MSVSLKEKLEALKLVEFQFSSFRKDVSSPDETGKRMAIFEFTLVKPIEKVYSSVGIHDPATGKRVYDFRSDVEVVKCSLDMIEKYEAEFTFEEVDGAFTGSGGYKGDLFLDLSRREEVWLTDTKFSKFGTDSRNNMKKERLASIYKKAGVATPTP